MDIICHRGIWNNKADQNTLSAFKAAFDEGFGIETDVRDHNGQLVISHDISSDASVPFQELLDIYGECGKSLRLALNIKADGLQALLKSQMQPEQITHSFFFDMSIPDMLGYLKQGLPVYSRQSEIEPAPALYEQASGIWIDCFGVNWLTETIVSDHLSQYKRVCFVSPELHGRPHASLWKWLREREIHRRSDVDLCTDLPHEARSFFSE